MEIIKTIIKSIKNPEKAYLEMYRILTGIALCNHNGVKIVLNHLGKINTFIDVGANIGQFTRIAEKLIPNARIIAFDPVDVFPFKDNIEVFHNFGLSDKNEAVNFYVNKLNVGWSGLYPPDDKIDDYYKKKIKLIRFDSLDIKIDSPCFLKVDTQGHEYQVLKGFGNRLKEIDCIQFEYSNINCSIKKCESLSKILRLLGEYRFNFIIQHNITKDSCNYILFKKEMTLDTSKGL